MSEEVIKKRELPLNRIIPEEFQTSHYATHFMVQFTGQEFILSFFEAIPPPIIGSQSEREAQLEALTSIDALCVGRITMSPDRFAQMTEILVNQVKGFKNDTTD